MILKIYLGALLLYSSLLQASLSLKLFPQNPPYELHNFYLLNLKISPIKTPSFEEAASSNECFITQNPHNLSLKGPLSLVDLPKNKHILYINTSKKTHHLLQELAAKGNTITRLSSFKKEEIKNAYKELKPDLIVLPLHLKKSLDIFSLEDSLPKASLALFYPPVPTAKNFTIILKKNKNISILLKRLTKTQKETISLKKEKNSFFDCHLSVSNKSSIKHSRVFSSQDKILAIGSSLKELKEPLGEFFEALGKHQVKVTLSTKATSLKQELDSCERHFYLFLPEKTPSNRPILKELKTLFKQYPQKQIFIGYYPIPSIDPWNLYHYHPQPGTPAKMLSRPASHTAIPSETLGGSFLECYLLKKLP